MNTINAQEKNIQLNSNMTVFQGALIKVYCTDTGFTIEALKDTTQGQLVSDYMVHFRKPTKLFSARMPDPLPSYISKQTQAFNKHLDKPMSIGDTISYQDNTVFWKKLYNALSKKNLLKERDEHYRVHDIEIQDI